MWWGGKSKSEVVREWEESNVREGKRKQQKNGVSRETGEGGNAEGESRERERRKERDKVEAEGENRRRERGS